MSMEKVKVLVADADKTFADALGQTLSGVYHVRICTDGIQALEQTKSFLPDVLVLDLMLPGVDGITLLQKCNQWGLTPTVLATSRYVSDYILNTVQKWGVGYFVIKPCSAEAVLCRISDMVSGLRPTLFATPEPRSQVSSALLQMGFSTKHRGYSYLREAVLLMAEDPRQSVTKELYPAVGAQCGVNASQVERSIRTAICAAWDHRPEQIWNVYFPEGMEADLSRPTNAAMISRLADGLLLASGE